MIVKFDYVFMIEAQNTVLGNILLWKLIEHNLLCVFMFTKIWEWISVKTKHWTAEEFDIIIVTDIINSGQLQQVSCRHTHHMELLKVVSVFFWHIAEIGCDSDQRIQLPDGL